jgi:hypothetical protein
MKIHRAAFIQKALCLRDYGRTRRLLKVGPEESHPSSFRLHLSKPATSAAIHYSSRSTSMNSLQCSFRLLLRFTAQPSCQFLSVVFHYKEGALIRQAHSAEVFD